MLAAGERAQEKFANVEAAGFYRRATEAAPQSARTRAPQRRARLGGSRRRRAARRSLRRGGQGFDHARRLAAKGSGDEVALMLKEGVIRERTGPLRCGPPLVFARLEGRRGAAGRPGADHQSDRARACLGGGPLPPGHVRRLHRVVQPGRRRRRRNRVPARPRARVLPAARLLHRARQPRANRLPRPRAADLRGAGRPARAGTGAEQPRHRRLLRGSLGRRARPLPAQPRGPRADRRRRRRRDGGEQHRRDQVRPGPSRRGRRSCSRRHGA